MNLLVATQSLIQMADHLEIEYREFPLELKAGRDPRELGWREKNAAEKTLFLLLQGYFAGQQKRIAERLQFISKSNPFFDALDDLWWTDEDLILRGYLLDYLTRAAVGSVNLHHAWTRKRFGVIVDDTLVDTMAADWARKYSAKLVTRVNSTTRKAIRAATENFVLTPGATLQDMMEQLPFKESRAQSIAITETTAAYSAGERVYTEELQARNPSLKIMRIWYTNRDTYYEGRVRRGVCVICAGLEGQKIRVDQQFKFKGKTYDGPPSHVACRCWSGRDIEI